MPLDNINSWASRKANVTSIFSSRMPAERYEFTLPQVGRDDDAALDSDVVKLDGINNGKSVVQWLRRGILS